MSSSVSDNGKYPEICLNAANHIALFRVFKQNKIYCEVLEHTDDSIADLYLRDMARQMSGNGDKLYKWLKSATEVNDKAGTPTIRQLHISGRPLCISNSTVRYAKVALDLISFFGSLRNKRIIEIGGGYGGQCVVTNALSGFESWTIVDLSGPSALQKKYILATAGSACADKVVLSHVDADNFQEVINARYDLVISNYAFSELTRAVQDVYAPMLQNAANGYLTMNYYELPGRFTIDDFQRMGKNIHVKQECPGMPLAQSQIYTW